MDLSIVIPVLNEQDNVEEVYEETNSVLKKLVKNYEIIFVDDGSWDKTFEKLTSIKDDHLVIIKLRANFGQSAAMDAGIKNATGKIIVMMDGDLQNDPKDIPRLIEKMGEGYDIVSGWRYKRKDPFGKRMASRLAYRIRKKIAKLDIHDSGCSLKAYTKESLEDIDLTGEMHRFIPDLATMKGFRVGEIKVNHRPRRHGKTKYKASRIVKGLLDLLIIYYWQRFAKRPMHFFGGIGTLLILLGGTIDLILIIRKIFQGLALANRPLFILSNFVLIMGVQFFMTGIIADIAMKNHYKITKKMNYSIEKIERK
jgi:glycosyltransferase involved in cell wall biosynthesis